MIEGGYYYDCGVMFLEDGQPRKSAYKNHAGLCNYSLHALYVLLLANFGSFCMALLTQPGMKERIHKCIISGFLPVRNYCMAQLRLHWLFIKDHLGLSEEQRSFFIMRVMKQFHQVYFCILRMWQKSPYNYFLLVK